MRRKIDTINALSTQFVCPKCKNHGATVEKLEMNQMGVFKTGQYAAAASCHKCGYTESFNLKEKQNLFSFLDSVFSKVAIHMPAPPGPMG